MQQIAYPFPVDFISLPKGQKIAFTETGMGGETMLFIHGLAGYMPLWQFQLQHFSENFHCIALDLPGNGLSPGGEYPYSMVFYAETIADFLKAKNISEVTLVGHSMGGQIAILMALRYPHLVNKLVLIAPAGFESFSPHEVFLTEHALDLGQTWGMNSQYLEFFINRSFSDKNPIASNIVSDLKQLMQTQNPVQWHNMIVASIKSMLREPVTPFLEQISQPTCIIFGELDAMIPNKLIHFQDTTRGVAYKGAALIEHSELNLIPAAGHFVQIEKSTEVNSVINSYLKALFKNTTS